jgi:molybdate transport system permease protein
VTRVRRATTTAPPWPVVVPAALAVLFLALPLVGLLVRAPWGRMVDVLTSPVSLDALRLSLVTGVSSTAVAFVLGVPLAWVLARSTWRGRKYLRALVTVPLVLPPVVGGIALLLAFGRRGLVGQYLDQWFGITLPFTTPGVVVAQVFVAMPFLVITVEGALRGLDGRLEEAAVTLGAGRFEVFRRVTLPLVAPSVVAGAVLTFARALGEFGATITFAGSLQGVTQTLPLAVYAGLEGDPAEAVVLSLVLLAVSVLVLVGMRDRWLRTGAAS